MGDVAASGGYYISCPADKIFASKNTITGSIGVFGLFFNVNGLMEKIGISIDGVKTNEHADVPSVYRNLTADEKNVIQQGVEDVYHTFISHVAEGRKMTTDQVDSIGQGRVWSGVNAKEIGLIDEFGGLKKAVKEAAKMANIENDFRIKEYPKKKEFMEEILSELSENAEAKILENKLGYSYKYYNAVNKIINKQGTQALMPFEYDIH
jgi:protease-4